MHPLRHGNILSIHTCTYPICISNGFSIPVTIPGPDKGILLLKAFRLYLLTQAHLDSLGHGVLTSCYICSQPCIDPTLNSCSQYGIPSPNGPSNSYFHSRAESTESIPRTSTKIYRKCLWTDLFSVVLLFLVSWTFITHFFFLVSWVCWSIIYGIIFNFAHHLCRGYMTIMAEEVPNTRDTVSLPLYRRHLASTLLYPSRPLVRGQVLALSDSCWSACISCRLSPLARRLFTLAMSPNFRHQ